MLKVLIADDEQKVCQLIHGLIPWESLDLQVVGMVHDGLAALEMLGVHQPDIMITDIRMPGMDGISLIREAKALLPALRCVIISGYRHFDYAHNAIKYGVEDYLLKPLQRQELIDTLEKLRSQRPAGETGTEPATASFLSDCFSQKLSGPALTVESILSEYRLGLPESGVFYALMIKADLSGVPARDTIRRIAAERVMDTSRATLATLPLTPHMGLLPEGIAALLCAPEEAAKALADALHTIRDKAELMRDLFPTLRVSMGLSRAARRLSDVPALFAQAYAALEMRLLHAEGALFFGRPSPAIALYLRSILLADTLRSLQTAIQSLHPKAYRAALLEGFAQMRATAGDNLPLLLTLLKEMVRLHFELLPHGTSLKEMEECIEALTDRWNAAVDMAQVEEGFASLLSDHLDAVDSARRQVEQLPLRRAKAYIRENFKKPLTLEEVAGIAGFNPAYFSTLFRKETGEKFIDYLASVRIAAARQLLTDSALSIPSIAEETGYGDAKYFAKQFKKATGLSPQEYRKLYG